MLAFLQHRSFRAWLCVAMLMSAVACGSKNSTPTAPTNASTPASPASAPGSATISGTVVGTSTTASAVSAQRITLTVSVSGTNVAASVDDNGHFRLTNVPAGTIDLHFVGTGIDAHLTITNVTANATLVITVRIKGNNANLEDRHDDGDDQDDAKNVEVEGKIAAGSLSGSCATHTLAFTVRTTKVLTNASTQFKDTTCAALKAGDSVEVKGARQADGSVLATRVERDN